MGGYQGDDMDVRRQQRAAIECLRHEGIKQVEIVETLEKVYRDKALSQLTVCRPVIRYFQIINFE